MHGDRCGVNAVVLRGSAVIGSDGGVDVGRVTSAVIRVLGKGPTEIEQNRNPRAKCDWHKTPVVRFVWVSTPKQSDWHETPQSGCADAARCEPGAS